ncbi:MAG: DUF4839 domain-containing protein [Clostridiales bacterium]|nr:DUF4839 domain-containing protein [Clostridiales bacterium]
MKEFTKKDIKEIRILLVVLAVLFGIIGVMAIIEKTHPGTIDTESQTSEIHTIEDESITKEVSSAIVLDNKDKVDDNYILTVDNCKEFADLFVEQSDEILEQKIKSFVDKYQYRTIEFDGNILLVEKYQKPSIKNKIEYLEGYYNILMYDGNYVENEMKAFSFYFDGVCNYDLGLEEGYLPDMIKTGDNVHIVAKIDEYDDYLNFLYLTPVSVTKR